MKMPNEIAEIVELFSESDTKHAWLWPNTPTTGNHQIKIIQRCKASDWAIWNRRSRTHKVSRGIELVMLELDKSNLSLLDVGAGDCVLSGTLCSAFPTLSVVALEPLDTFDTHEFVLNRCATQIVHVRGYLQQLLTFTLSSPVDLVMMMNSYRQWSHAKLPEGEKDLPELFDKWIGSNSRFAIVTASTNQIFRSKLIRSHIRKVLGRGEDRSWMLLLDFKKLER